jgi:tetratricopeptide (TPR) repeat protein
MYDTILDALRRNATGDALRAARELVAEQPTDAEAHRWLAAALQQSGEAQAALASIDTAIALAPEMASLHVARAGLLVGSRQAEAAREALSQASGLDPNQFDAYAMQAQLALGRGDLDEAQRLSRLAARVEPEHPQLAAIDGMLALRRGDGDSALKIVTAALQRAPDDTQLRYALGFIYMEKGHLAFAEQAFRSILAKTPAANGLLPLIADLLRRQGLNAEALAELAPLLADPQASTPAVQRFAGQLHLASGDPEQALPLLLQVLARQPADPATLGALVDLGHVPGFETQVRDALEAALATSPGLLPLWQARVAVEPMGEGGPALLERWATQMPSSTAPLAVLLQFHVRRGDSAAADVVAERMLALDPEEGMARAHVLGALLVKDPRAAIAQIETWLPKTPDPARQQGLLGWLGQAQDRSGQRDQAVSTWLRFHALGAASLAPLPPASTPPAQWPDLGPLPESPPMTLFLVGLPGSGVERLAAVFAACAEQFQGDRLGARAPRDGFQDPGAIEALASGRLGGDAFVAQWRAALPARGVRDGHVIDWLPWWDNAFLLGLRPFVREGMVMVAVRDPRDMLLEWLAFGTSMPFALPDLTRAAGWLATVLSQLALLVDQQWYPNRVVHTDQIGDDPAAAAAAMSEAMGIELPVPATVGMPRFPPGHWREYAEPLAEPFAQLTPVAVAMGYPER